MGGDVVIDPAHDHGDRPSGWLASVRLFVAQALARDPEPPPSWTPPRGLGQLNSLIADIDSASTATVLPVNPPAKLASGYEYRTIPLATWASRAGLDPDVAAIAWALASEAPSINKYPAYSLAIAECICNAGVQLVTRDRRPEANGHLGRQGGRWCASFQPPTRRHVRCAELVWARHRAGGQNILARGGVQWLDPLAQVAMHRKRPETNSTPEDVVRRRYASGRRWGGPAVDAVGHVVLDPFVLMTFGAEGVELGEALAAVADGRKRWRRPV